MDEAPIAEQVAQLGQLVVQLCRGVGIELVPADELPVRQQELRQAVLDSFARAAATEQSNEAEALHMMLRILECLPPESPSRPRLMTAVSRVAHGLLPGRRGDHALLDTVVEVMRRVTAPGSADDPGLTDRLGFLNEVLTFRFDARGAVDDLRAAAEAAREVVRLHPASDPFHPRHQLNLAASLSRLAHWTGDDGLLDEAVGIARSAVAEIPADDRDRPLALHKLAFVLAERYQRTDDARDLDESVTHRRTSLAAWDVIKAADPAAADEENHDVFLSGLCNVLRMRFLRFEDRDDLAEAISLGRGLMSQDPSGQPRSDRSGPMTNLAAALMLWAQHESDRPALDEAITLFRRIRDGSAGTPLASRHLGNLGLALGRRYAMAGDVADLAEAIALHEQAAAQADPEQPDLTEHWTNAARALWNRFEAQGDRADLERAAALYERAAFQPNGTTRSRVSAAYAWGRSRAELGAWDSALRGFTLAVELLPRLALHRLGPADQAELMGKVFGLASAGAGCALQAGDPAAAVALLEHSRGVLAEQLLGADEDLALLNDRDPELARRFEGLRQSLDGRGGPGGSGSLGDSAEVSASAGGQGTVHAWNRMVREIRDVIPGFFSPPSTADLLGRLGGRTVVLLNTSEYRSDCLVLKDGAITVVPIEGVTSEDFIDQTSHMLRGIGRALGELPDVPRQEGEEVLLDLLDWVWEKVGRPVMAAAGYLTGGNDRMSEGTSPRLWWIPCGMSGFLPLHAAGRRPGTTGGDARAGEPQSVSECVVSSYAPTLRGLLRTRDSHGPHPVRDRPALVVAAVEDDLPGVAREIGVLEGLVPVDVLAGPDATVEAVKERLPHHPVVHFACHGIRDPEDPGASRFLLSAADGGALTVRDLVGLRLPAARLAYLSVCSTALAATSSLQLVDEALTLSASMHVAGFRNVIGALWPVNDLIAVRLVRDVYVSMRSAHRSVPPGPAANDGVPYDGARYDAASYETVSVDADRSAGALHAAVAEFRRLYPELPSLWASHVHVGG